MADKKTMAELYNEERNKLTQLPDSDADFVALSNAYDRKDELKGEEI